MNSYRTSSRHSARAFLIKICSAGLAFLLTTGLAVIGWVLFPQLLKKDW
jgi:hypothetical protein